MISQSRLRVIPALLLSGFTAACAGHSGKRPPVIDLDAPQAIAAIETPAPARPVTVVAVPEPLPLPGQLKPFPEPRAAPEPGDPQLRVSAANRAARVEPVRDGFLNAIQQYPFDPGALYQIYAAPGQVTDIVLEEGEQLVGPGPVAAGDTVRWVIGDTVSGTGAAARVHVLVKPTRTGLVTNLVINTDRRTYHLELRSHAITYMASISWTYPHDQLRAAVRASADADAAAPVAEGLALDALRFRYAISGDDPPWRPLRAFDDGTHVYVEFPAGIAQGELPPLFVVDAAGTGALVNYRVVGRHIIVDRLFAAAELRLGDKRSEQVVRITRTDGRKPGKRQ